MQVAAHQRSLNESKFSVFYWDARNGVCVVLIFNLLSLIKGVCSSFDQHHFRVAIGHKFPIVFFNIP